MRILVVAIVIVVASGSALAGPTAEELFDQAQEAYDRGDWPAAIEKWQRSYNVSGAADLLFNLAQAYRLSGDCARALSRYKRFVELDPKAKDRGLADDFIRELGPTCGGPSPVDSQPALVGGLKLDDRLTRHEDRGGRTLRIAGIATGAGGIAAIATGLVLGHHAQTLADEVTDACRTSCDWATQKDKDAAGRSDATIGRVLDVVGAAAVAGGAIMYYLGVRGNNVTVLLVPGERGAVASWSRSW